MKKLLFSIVGALFLASVPLAADRPPPAVTEAEFLPLLQKQIGEMPAGWEAIQVLKFDPAGKKGLPVVSVAIYYSDPPTSLKQVKGDTKTLVVAAHAVLKSRGIDPKGRGVFIHGRGRKNEKNDVGDSVVRMYGVSTYSPYSAEIEFEKNK